MPVPPADQASSLRMRVGQWVVFVVTAVAVTLALAFILNGGSALVGIGLGLAAGWRFRVWYLRRRSQGAA